ncbi:VOC family protein [Reyranella sp. CPCC 100927]|uniref:VOC family protein n=1 Tax=Reyranella sp. CPCC 100927 TaxID=2599616 RepID=UPI0011B7EC2E|nr:VOC family protein [Reyranella sp. CPCC 100927]TWT10545.1 VOC family protein [Reyranella sp. CPCC 100927]
MPETKGRFVWFELMTTDMAAAKAFYGTVVGWGTQDASMPDMAYTLFTDGAAQVAGLMTLPEEACKAGAQPAWVGYVAVDDVDASTAQAQQLGGTVHVPPTDIPNIGRFSMITDPQQAAVNLFKSTTPQQDQPSARGVARRIGWHELLATDAQKVFDFYNAMFGWKKSDAIDMGPMGTYQLFAVGDDVIGGMFNRPPVMPVPFWLYYFNVGDIDAAGERVKSAGGQILNGPMEVPGGDWIIQGADPQGAMFALVGKRG